MAEEPLPAQPLPFPRVPAFAWGWLQRSRPVLAEVAQRLTGEPPGDGFVDWLRGEVERDTFASDVLLHVVADVAFRGRVPERRPPGASWDRGLTWWAATLAGVTVGEYEARGEVGEQRSLFGAESQSPSTPPRRLRAASPERRAVLAALRDLVASADGEHVPVSAVRALIRALET